MSTKSGAAHDAKLEGGASIAWDPEEYTYLLTVPLTDLREADLSRALELATAAVRDVHATCARVRPLAMFDMFDIAFERAGGERITQRAFFDACVALEPLRSAVAGFVRALVDDRRSRATPRGVPELWHDEMHPVGSFAIAPLALAAAEHVPLAIAQMDVSDLGHETFHQRWIDLLIARHGWREETLDLIAFRASRGYGQHGNVSLGRACAHHGLVAHLDATSGQDAFLERLARWRKDDATFTAPEWTAKPGQSMYAGDALGYRSWVARLARLEGRQISDYPPEPAGPWELERYDPSADWDDSER
jgi:hypothetical protein